MNRNFSCYIISETTLGMKCAQILLNFGHKILGIISNEPETLKWANKQNIYIIDSLGSLEEISIHKPADYLFSIVNNKVLTPQLLEKYRSAINYHDSLLPTYAGVHATSWAIINNEPYHGITWHYMSATVDAGDILKQRKFEIDKDETALSLNIKCYIHALEAFEELVRDLYSFLLSSKTQDLKKRSYFSSVNKPNNCGFVQWDSPSDEIDRLYRATYFGSYPNTFCTYFVRKGSSVPYF